MTFDPWTRVGLHADVRFTLSADADPSLLPRLLQPFARRDLTPDRVDAVRAGDCVHIEIVMASIPAEMVHLVAGNLRAVIGVRRLDLRQEITGAVQRRAA